MCRPDGVPSKCRSYDMHYYIWLISQDSVTKDFFFQFFFKGATASLVEAIIEPIVLSELYKNYKLKPLCLPVYILSETLCSSFLNILDFQVAFKMCVEFALVSHSITNLPTSEASSSCDQKTRKCK